MDFDIHLAQNNSTNEVIFRVYRWKPYCISLGANQKLEEINFSKAESDNIEVVKRPTGGRAILHSEELTYSVIYPIDYKTSAHNLYRQINLALKKGLGIYDNRLSTIELENKQPNFKNFYKQDKSSLCFAVSAKSEINFESKKLAGSAQRKIGGVILQHGSILCGNYHLRITDYLNLNENLKVNLKDDLISSTTDIFSILNEEVNYHNLITSLKLGFEWHFNTKFECLKELILAS